jgi:hypothetical protein
MLRRNLAAREEDACHIPRSFSPEEKKMHLCSLFFVDVFSSQPEAVGIYAPMQIQY